MHRITSALALLAAGCLTPADGMVYVETQQIPAASGLAAHAQFELYGGQYLPSLTLVEDNGLSAWGGYDEGSPELTWLHGDTQPELEDYLDIEGFVMPGIVVVSVVADPEALEKFTVRWGMEWNDGNVAMGRVEHVDPSGLGLHAGPWLGEDFYLDHDGLVMLPGVLGVGSLQLMASYDEPLVGDGMATVVQAGGGLEGAVGDRIPVMAGRVPIDPSLGDGSSVGIIALEDGREIEVPPVRALGSVDEIDASWSLSMYASDELFSLQLEDPAGHTALIPDATSGWIGPEDEGGGVLVNIDEQPNDGSLGCRGHFVYQPEADWQLIEVCIGGACATSSVRGLVDRYDGEGEGCPW